MALMRNSALSFCLFFQACSPQEGVNQEVSFTPFPQTEEEEKKITGNQLTENNEDEYQVFVPFCARAVLRGMALGHHGSTRNKQSCFEL